MIACMEDHKSVIHLPSIISMPVENVKSAVELRYMNQLQCPILRLPRELRDIVLDCVVSDSSCPLDSNRTGLPAMLQVCHQLRDETAEIYYGRKLILAGGAPSPQYEKGFFSKFDPEHKKYVRRVHWLWDSYGTADRAMARAAELDRLTGLRDGTWTVGYIDVFGSRSAKSVYVNALGVERKKGAV